MDSAYTFETLKERKIEHLVTAKDLDGYFDTVLTCHPVGTINHRDSDVKKFGIPIRRKINARNVFIEGKIGFSKYLAKLGVLNFILSQIILVIYLSKLVKSENIDFIRAEDAHYNGLVALLIAKLMKKPLLIGVWGNPDVIRDQSKKPITKRLFRTVAVERAVEAFVLARCDIAMVQNIENKGFLDGRNVPDERIEIVRFGNLIDPIHFNSPEEKLRLKPTEIDDDYDVDCKILVLARLEKIKMVDHVLQAFTVSNLKDLNLRLYFVGDGSLRNEMEQFAKEHALIDKVVFCGERDQVWIARALQEVDFIVSPLTGRALAEVALAGKPVIAYDVDWHSELVSTGETGYLVKYMDIDGLSDAIHHLYFYRKNNIEMGEKIRAKALDLLNVEKNTINEISIYEKLRS